ncbi:MAG: iron-containing alcohol dehydrogenase [Deltaproteobacteria bacterium]|nr:iron-containing alcohol dehydrogenase [Deltaproteobacteria bacterium]
MENFVLHNPTKIIFGRDTVPLIGKETVTFGKNVLLVYGRNSLKKSGLYDAITSALQDSGAKITEHSGVQTNPLHFHVMEGVEKCKAHSCDVICAAGGGSVIDEAKAISAGALVRHDVWKFLTGKKSIKKTLPVTAVPTLAASGSEANSGMVITHEIKKLKFGFANRHLFPRTSILDPVTTCSVPASYTAYGSVDMLSHFLELYFSCSGKESPVQDSLMEGMITNIIRSTDRCLAARDDYNARAELMWIASLALNGIFSAGLGRVEFPLHLIEHAISALYGVPHGAGLAIIIPGWMRYSKEQQSLRMAQLGEKSLSIKEGTADSTSDAAIEYLLQWFNSINVPTSLEDIGVEVKDISRIADNALAQAKVWRMKNISAEVIEQVLHLCRRR